MAVELGIDLLAVEMVVANHGKQTILVAEIVINNF